MLKKDDKCFICGRNRHAGLELHHIFGGARRRLSDKYGLVVTLCHDCHNEPPFGAHHNKETMLYLHQEGQRMAEKNGMSRKDFIKIFGRGYL
ncbi:MAG: hypothetical protein J1G06_08590 [Oscillospiraceae bacterium]|nr:hypothetical protein [Oscillospiraceae bacterium]